MSRDKIADLNILLSVLQNLVSSPEDERFVALKAEDQLLEIEKAAAEACEQFDKAFVALCEMRDPIGAAMAASLHVDFSGQLPSFRIPIRGNEQFMGSYQENLKKAMEEAEKHPWMLMHRLAAFRGYLFSIGASSPPASKKSQSRR